MATTLNVPGDYPSISAAMVAAVSGDTIVVAAGYGGNEAADVTINDLTFSAPAGVPNIVLSAGAGAPKITLADASPIRIIGDTGNNRFIGNAGANDINDGNGGNDTIYGGAGDDLITSTGGTDTLKGGSGNDRIRIDGAGAGEVDGGTGIDTVQSVDLGSHTFSNVETLDTYYGFISASITQVASFSKITADLSDADSDIAITLNGVGGTLVFSARINGAHSLTLWGDGLASGIDLTGSVNDDFLVGSHFNDMLKGGSGDDFILGGFGNDTLVGDSGADILDGGFGNDMLVGNGDGDTAAYFDSIGVKVSLDITSAQFTRSAGYDTLSGITNLIGSDYRDELLGDDNANRLDGGAGNDTLIGADGNDVLNGGIADDKLLGGAGADALDGGAGTDRAQYSNATAGVRTDLQKVSINTGDAAGDTYVSIENLVGSNHDDSLRGDAGDNGIWGKDGSDALFGRNGNDRLNGGDGNDTLNGGVGDDSYIFSSALNATTNVDHIVDFSVVDDTIDLDHSVFAALSLGTLAADAFFIGATAPEAQAKIIYDSANGALFYDADGNGAGAAIQFATVSTGLALTYHDFFIM